MKIVVVEEALFSIADVHYAILENSGTLSVLPKAENKPLTLKDMQMSLFEGSLTKDFVIDGKLMHSGKKTDEWVIQELQKHNAVLSDVFYVSLAAYDSLYI